jgi:membrane-bound lytic murein transglycosylase MltF
MRLLVDTPFTGDFDEMIKHRMIRVGVTFNRTHYFIDKGQERGLTYEALIDGTVEFANDPVASPATRRARGLPRRPSS